MEKVFRTNNATTGKSKQNLCSQVINFYLSFVMSLSAARKVSGRAAISFWEDLNFELSKFTSFIIFSLTTSKIVQKFPGKLVNFNPISEEEKISSV